jgi:hypothetical protein
MRAIPRLPATQTRGERAASTDQTGHNHGSTAFEDQSWFNERKNDIRGVAAVSIELSPAYLRVAAGSVEHKAIIRRRNTIGLDSFHGCLI